MKAKPKVERDDRERPLLTLFKKRGWTPAPFQREVWRRYLDGESGLLHTPTGSGKTLGAIGGPLLEALKAQAENPRVVVGNSRKKRVPGRPRVLWITPLRALAADTTASLRATIDELGLQWTTAMRTGDASARDRRLSKAGTAELIVITPESLALMLTYPDNEAIFSELRCVIVDEWHELLGNKRGVLLQLCLARLRRLSPAARCWGLSATIGNLSEARDVLLFPYTNAAIVSGVAPRTLKLETLLPRDGKRFPWAGHLGLIQLQSVLKRLLKARTSIIFTNTRSQAELWHQALAAVWPQSPSLLALHHGSLDVGLRRAAEQGLRDGSVRCVVSTSSLDLGVDFPAVDLVFQIGSPKGVARLLQRSGRAHHRPGEAGHVVCVPSHALELAEYAAAREAVARGEIESRTPPTLCLDVLAQHCVTIALGTGFTRDDLFAEARSTHAFAHLTPADWNDVLNFIVHGGAALSNYPEFNKVVSDPDGVYRVTNRAVAVRHRLSVGTIISDGSVAVRFLRGGRLGAVEEQFIGRMKRGDIFQFAGRTLVFHRLENMTAYVKLAKKGSGVVPRWQGARMPLSSELGSEVERVLAQSENRSAEMTALRPMLELQTSLSALPRPDATLVEVIARRDGLYLMVYLFAGRAWNEGIAALASLRWSRRGPNTFSYAANDYGFVIASARDAIVDEELVRELLSPLAVTEDLLQCVNLGELSRRQFREVARIAGLLPPSLPGRAARSMRQLQASSGLLFDVLERYDPLHMLLSQARSEVLSAQLDVREITGVLTRIGKRRIDIRRPVSLTPLSFPLWAERWRGELSSEDWKTRVMRVAEQLETRNV